MVSFGKPSYDALMQGIFDLANRRGGVDLTVAETIALAAEIRAADETHPTRYATQDIQLRHCHCAMFVVRLGTEGRWWHPESKTHCDDENPVDFYRPTRQVVVGVGGAGGVRAGSVNPIGSGGSGGNSPEVAQHFHDRMYPGGAVDSGF